MVDIYISENDRMIHLFRLLNNVSLFFLSKESMIHIKSR